MKYCLRIMTINFLLILSAVSVADPATTTAATAAPNDKDNISASTEVTIAPSTMQLNQVKLFFDHANYQSLENNKLSSQHSLTISSDTGEKP